MGSVPLVGTRWRPRLWRRPGRPREGRSPGGFRQADEVGYRVAAQRHGPTCRPPLPAWLDGVHPHWPGLGLELGEAAPWKCGSPPEIPLFPGVAGRPRAHLGPSERQIGLALSLPPLAGAQPASPGRASCAHVCACVGAQPWPLRQVLVRGNLPEFQFSEKPRSESWYLVLGAGNRAE